MDPVETVGSKVKEETVESKVKEETVGSKVKEETVGSKVKEETGASVATGATQGASDLRGVTEIQDREAQEDFKGIRAIEDSLAKKAREVRTGLPARRARMEPTGEMEGGQCV